MNSKFSQLSNDERDLRLTAFILGELSSDEAAELQHAIAADPELARAFERRKQAIELIRETAAMGEVAPEDSVPLRLSDDRREKLLERFKTPAMANAPAEPSPRKARWYVPMSIAAILIGLLVVATGMFENSFRTQELAEMELLGISDSTAKPGKELAELVLGKRVQISGQIDVGRKLTVAKPSAATPAPQNDAPVISRLTPKDSDYAIALPQFVQEEDGNVGYPSQITVSGIAGTVSKVTKAVPMDGVDLAGLPVAEAPPMNSPGPVVYSANAVGYVNPALPNVSQRTVTLNGFTHSFPDDVDALLVTPNGTVRSQDIASKSPAPAGPTVWSLNDRNSLPALATDAVNGISSSPADFFGRNSFETLASTDRNGEAALRNPVPQSINAPAGGIEIAPVGGSKFFRVNEPKTQPPGQAQGAEYAQVPIAGQSVFKGEAEVLARRNMLVDAAGLPSISTDPNSSADTKRPLREVRAANTEPVFANTQPTVLGDNSTLTIVDPATQWAGAKRESLGESLPSSPYSIGFSGGGGGGDRGGRGGRGVGQTAFYQRFGAGVQRFAGADTDQSGPNALDTPVEKKLDARQLSDLAFDSGMTIAQAQSVGRAGATFARGSERDKLPPAEPARPTPIDTERPAGRRVEPTLRSNTWRGIAVARGFYDNNPTESSSRMFANTTSANTPNDPAGHGASVLGLQMTPVPAPAPVTEVISHEAVPAEKLAELTKKGIEEVRLVTADGSTASSITTNSAFLRHGQDNGALHFLPARGEPAAAAKPAAPAPTPQPEVLTRENSFSTFSLNVSDVSFKLAAASLEKGAMPEAASIRGEEFVNAFDYRDPRPAPGAPLAFAWERARYPFAHNRDAVRFSIKTAAQGRETGKPLNIVLLLDNSGSMERADRVRIIQESLRTLAAQLKPQDKLSVVTFSRTASLRVDGVSGTNAAEVAKQIGALTPEGGTNLEDALDLAYRTALKHYEAAAVNRIVLLTDGAANLGNVEPSSLKAKVESYRKQGIALDCFGIGWEGFNDDLLEQLSRNGDGRYGFVNTPEEAASEFVGQLAGALRVAASDVKMQVEFNPKRVTAFRQIGYAKHQLTKEQFRDNKVDAAEIGAAESGNALYIIETNPNGEGPVATVRARFRVPNTGDYREHEWLVPFGPAVELQQARPSLRLAATASAFSEWLVSSPFAGEVTPDRLLQILSGVPETCGADPRPKKLEWMIRQAKSISGK